MLLRKRSIRTTRSTFSLPPARPVIPRAAPGAKAEPEPADEPRLEDVAFDKADEAETLEQLEAAHARTREAIAALALNAVSEPVVTEAGVVRRGVHQRVGVERERHVVVDVGERTIGVPVPADPVAQLVEQRTFNP